MTVGRWLLAGVAAAALAWTTITSEMPWVDPAFSGHIVPPAGTACAADAAPAALNHTLADVSGRPVTLSDFSGRVVLLNFWATWCVPCRVEIPWFVEFQRQYGAEGLQVIGVSVDAAADMVAPFAETMKINYPVLLAAGQDALLDAYGPMAGIPTTVLISRDGRVCSKHVGLTTKDAVERGIRALLGQPRVL